MREPDSVPSFPEQFNLADYFLFDRIEEGKENHTAIRFGELEYTYGEVARRSKGFAQYLRSKGITPEQRIYTVLPDSPPFAWSFYGTLAAGAVVAMGNPYAPVQDLDHVVRYSRTPVVVTLPETALKLVDTFEDCSYLKSVLLVPDVETGEERVHTRGEPEVPSELTDLDMDVRPFEDAVEAGRDQSSIHLPETHRDETAIWLFTAGSTGRAKAAVHAHGDFAFNTEVYAKQTMEFGSSDMFVSVPNLYFGYATGTNLMFPFATGGTVGLYSCRPTPESLHRAIDMYQPDIVTNVPTMLSKMLDYDDRCRENGEERMDMSSVRYHISAGEALPPSLYEQFTERFDTEICDGIGSAEMFHIYAANSPGDVKPGSLGREVNGYEIQLLPVDAGGPGAEPVDPGEIGEMWVRGDSVAKGYYRNRNESWETFYGHWCRTGDLFRRDEDGYYWFVDRADNMFKASGIWVAPQEVEDCLQSHPSIRLAAVIPAEQEDGLVKPKAFVEIREEYSKKIGQDLSREELTEQLQEYVKNQISKHKYPRWIEYKEEIPRNDRGKVDRAHLKSTESEEESV